MSDVVSTQEMVADARVVESDEAIHGWWRAPGVPARWIATPYVLPPAPPPPDDLVPLTEAP